MSSRISAPPELSHSPLPKRPDTFTYHFGSGRGVRWHDKPRDLPWLCAFDDAHDRGYEHAARLQQSALLYPDIEQHGVQDLPWGHIVELVGKLDDRSTRLFKGDNVLFLRGI